MAIKVGYKQQFEVFNESFDKKDTPVFVSEIIKTKYNPKLKKTDNIAEFLKRPDRFMFYIYIKNSKALTHTQKTFIFDKEKDAIREQKKATEKYVDNRIKLYQKKVKNGKKLTQEERLEVAQYITL